MRNHSSYRPSPSPSAHEPRALALKTTLERLRAEFERQNRELARTYETLANSPEAVIMVREQDLQLLEELTALEPSRPVSHSAVPAWSGARC
jgi:hypothetical protein